MLRFLKTLRDFSYMIFLFLALEKIGKSAIPVIGILRYKMEQDFYE